jgi:hypothetical protein
MRKVNGHAKTGYNVMLARIGFTVSASSSVNTKQ